MLLSTLDRSQPLFYFVPQDSHSQAGSTSPRLASNLTPNNKIASSLITAQKDQDHSTKESMQASISEDALAALQKKGQQASSSARGLYYPSNVQAVFSGFFSSGWGRNLVCTRDDCTTQLQWWKSCQVCSVRKDKSKKWLVQGAKRKTATRRLDFSAQLWHM